MKSKENELTFIYLISDLVLLNMAIIFLSRFGLSKIPADYNQLTIYFLHANLSWVIAFFVFPKKIFYLQDGFLNRFIRISSRSLVFLIVSTIIAIVTIPEWYSIKFLIQFTFLFYSGELVFYWLLERYHYYESQKGNNSNRAIIIGINDTSIFLRDVIESNPILGYKFLGFVSQENQDDPEVIGHPDQIASLITKYNVETVFASHSLFSDGKGCEKILRICNYLGVHLRIVPTFQNWTWPHGSRESIENLILINPQLVPLDDLRLRMLKRGFDVVFSSLVIVFLFSWLFPILALAIKIGSRGPVFFVQKRTGTNQKEFPCIKFRSMATNALADVKQATANDKRITRLGHFLRDTHLDELPQFINVFLGHMSVVGPRPHMLKHTTEYSKLVNHYLNRHFVKPGITGLAQVNGFCGETRELWKMEKRVRYDLEYIEKYNFAWDIQIIFNTLFSSETKVAQEEVNTSLLHTNASELNNGTLVNYLVNTYGSALNANNGNLIPNKELFLKWSDKMETNSDKIKINYEALQPTTEFSKQLNNM
jgi:putative colanic acid biosynthesis UDP-glucose lipid carrier transferase